MTSCPLGLCLPLSSSSPQLPWLWLLGEVVDSIPWLMVSWSRCIFSGRVDSWSIPLSAWAAVTTQTVFRSAHPGDRDVAQPVECSPGRQEALGSIPRTSLTGHSGVPVHACDLSTLEVEEERAEGHIARSGL